MHINQAGLDIIKHFEGLRLTAYRDPVGIVSIGYGHTGPDVHEGLVWSRERAEGQLLVDCYSREIAVSRYVTTPLTENQFSACVSLCYNIGAGNFRDSLVTKYLNDRKFKDAADAFFMHVTAKGKPFFGLVRRRIAEAALFKTAPASRPSRLAMWLSGVRESQSAQA